MKKLIALSLVFVLLLSGCGGKETTQPTEAPLPEVSYPVPQVNMVTYSEEGLTDEQILQQRRDIVEAKMRHMMGMLWTPAEDITYRHAENDFTLQTGRIYRGMPYSHGSGSGYSWLMYSTGQDENGVHTISIDGKMMTGNKPSEGCISNDCADAVFWAWASVSSSITFPYTDKMSSYTGCLQVGDYYWPNTTRFGSSTKPIVQENGEDVMFAAYAQLQKGDGMVLYTNSAGGHAVMVAEAVVVMNGDKIDGDASYVRILEQESAGLNAEETYYDESIGATVYIACGYDEIWSFNTIYKKGYLPITCKELIDPSPLAEQTVTDTATEFSESNMFTGRLTSAYRLSSVTYTVYDKDGRAVQQATCFVREADMYEFDLYHFENVLDQAYQQGTLDLDTLPAGTYKCVLTCQISTGSIIELRNFEITR